MNKTLVFHYLSKITLIGSLIFLLPAAVSLIYGEYDVVPAFVIVAAGLAVLSLPMTLKKPASTEMYTKEGLVIVAMLWIVLPIAGALPFVISGEIPRFVDALFESVLDLPRRAQRYCPMLRLCLTVCFSGGALRTGSAEWVYLCSRSRFSRLLRIRCTL